MSNESTSRESLVTKRSNSISLSIAAAVLLASLGLSGCTGLVAGPHGAASPAPNPTPSGTLSAVPSSATFPNVVVGTSSSQTITLTNSETTTITLSQSNVSGTGFSTTGLTVPVTIPAGQTASFNAVFTSASAGASTGSISLVSDAKNSPLAISLSGTGVAATHQLQFNPKSFAFGNVLLGSDQDQDLLLVNTGNSTVNISGATISGAGFTLSGLSGAIGLAPGQSVILTADFAPTVAGNATSTVAVTSNATNAPTSLLSGTGVTPSVTLTWDPSTSVVGYNVYRGTLVDGPYTKLNLVSATQFVDLTVQTGQTYTYVVTSVDASNVESSYSNPSTATID